MHGLFNYKGMRGRIEDQQVAFGKNNRITGSGDLKWNGSEFTVTGNLLVSAKTRFGGTGPISQTERVRVEGDFTVTGTNEIDGGQRVGINLTTMASLTILKTDFFIFADTSIQDITLTLPAIIAGAPGVGDDGRLFRVQKAFDSTNSLTITPQSPSQINSEVTDIVMGLKNDNTTYIAQGGNWFVVNRDTDAFGAIEQQTPGTQQGLTGTLTKLAIFDTNRFATPGICTSDHTTDVISIDHIESVSLGGDGYRMEFRFEVSGYSNNQEIGAEVFVNGVGTNIQTVQQTSVGLNTIVQAEGVFQVAAGSVDVEVRVIASNVETATFETAQFVIQRLAK